MNRDDLKLIRLDRALLPAIAQLWRSAAKFDPCSLEVLAEKAFEDDGVRPAYRMGFAKEDTLAGFAIGAVRSDQGFVKLIAVAPAFQRRGLGVQLLQEIESTCRSDGAIRMRVAESAPNYLTPGIDARNVATIALFNASGYSQIGEAVNQSVDLSARDWNSSTDETELAREHAIQIDRANPEDVASIDAFLDLQWPSWKSEVHSALANRPPTIHVAKHRGRIIAFAAHDANNKGTSWFGPMGTSPDFGSKGIGRMLLYRCLADMKAQGHQTATIPWVGPLGFYEKHADAMTSRNFIRMEKLLE